MRRWLFIGIGTLVLAAGRAAGLVTPSWLTLLSGIGAIALINYGLGRLVRLGARAKWLLPTSIALDLTIAGLLVLLFGPGGLILGFLAAFLPYTPLYGQKGLVVLASSGAISYLAAALIHETLVENLALQAAASNASHYFEAALLALAGVGLGRPWEILLSRLQSTRAILDRIGTGSAGERLPVDLPDDLGRIGMSINTILDRVDGSAAAMHSQADLIARAAERFAKAARDLADSCQAAVETVNRLAGDLRSHDESGEEDLAIAADMAATA
ncbi:MAG: methyl-accepting chemotaxis protein, partial [Gemmatimonadota bacterium]